MSKFASQITGLNISPQALGVTAIIGTMSVLRVQAAESIDRVAKLSDRLGTSTEAIISLEHAGNLANVSAETLDKALTKLGVNLAKAEGNSKGAEGAFAQLGLRASDLASMDRVEAFARIADSIAAIPNPAERAAVAVELFGKAGAELLPLMQEGGDGIRQAAQDARALGTVISRADARVVEESNDAWTRLGESVKGVGTTLAIVAAPPLKLVADVLTFTVSTLNHTARAFTDAFGWTGRADDGKAKIAAVSAETIALQESVKTLEGKLREQITTFGLTGEALSIYQLQLDGATSQQLNQANKLESELRALRTVAEKSQALQSLNESLKEQQATLGMTAEEVEIYRLSLKGLTEAELFQTRVAALSLQDMRGALALKEQIKATEAGLQSQLSTVGVTGAQLEVYKLQLAGATDAQVANAQALATKVDAAQKAAESQLRLSEAIKGTEDSMRDQLATAGMTSVEMEVYRLKMQGATKAQLQHARAMAQQIDGQKGGGNQKLFAGAMDVGSKEARSTILAFRRGGADEVQKRIERNTRTQIDAQKAIVVAVKELTVATATMVPIL